MTARQRVAMWLLGPSVLVASMIGFAALVEHVKAEQAATMREVAQELRVTEACIRMRFGITSTK